MNFRMLMDNRYILKQVLLNAYFCWFILFIDDSIFILSLIVYFPILYFEWLIGTILAIYDFSRYHLKRTIYVSIDVATMIIFSIPYCLKWMSIDFMVYGIMHKLIQYLLTGIIILIVNAVRKHKKIEREKRSKALHANNHLDD